MEVHFKRVKEIEEDVESLLENLSWKEMIKAKDTVVLKPNFCTYSLKDGVTTNLSLIRALVDLFSKRARHVLVGETSSNWNNLDRLIRENDFGCEFINLSHLEPKEFDSPFGRICLPSIIFESRLVNLPVLKTHVLTTLTLGIKNLFGLVQLKEKHRYHRDIDQVLQWILETVKPDINILDATYSMLGRGGPTSGRVVRTDLLLGSHDVVALDVVSSRIYGMDLENVRHIYLAAQKYGTIPRAVGDVDFLKE